MFLWQQIREKYFGSVATDVLTSLCWETSHDVIQHIYILLFHDDQRWSLHRSAPHRSRDTEVQLMLLPQLWTSLSLCPCTHYHVPNNQKCGSLSLLYKIIIFIFPKVSQLWKLFGDQTMNQVIMCLTIMYARTRARSILLFPSSSGVDRCRPKSTKI